MLEPFEVHQIDQRLRPRFPLIFGDSPDLRPEDDILPNRSPGEEGVLLEDHSREFLVAVGGGDLDRAAGRLFEPSDDLEQGGLAAARGPHDDQQLALLDVETDPAERHHLFAGSLDAPDFPDLSEPQNGGHQRGEPA